MQPRVTPGGRVYHPAIPGDELRAVREEALAREAMQNMRESEQGRALMAEAWKKFQEHYAAEWEEAYPDDIFPSPAPPPATVSRESVAAAMMRQWAKNLRADPIPPGSFSYQDGPIPPGTMTSQELADTEDD